MDRQFSPPGSPDLPPLKRSSSDRTAGACVPQAAKRRVQSSNLFRNTNESPRQVSAAVILFVCFAVCANSAFDERPGSSLRRVMLAFLLFLVVYSVLNTRDGVTRRPHYAVWRALHGVNLWYCLVVAAMLIVPTPDGVFLMGWIFPGVERNDLVATPDGAGTCNMTDPSHSCEVAQSKTLGFDHLDCSITFETVKRQFLGIWFLAHSLGWWAKMLMLRDFRTCLVYSTMFEFTELTLQFMVPEFQECWWDSLIMDWLIANLIGMMFGKLTLKLLNAADYNWSSNQASLAARAWHTVTPASWSEYSWNPTNDPVTMVLNAVIWVVMMVGEVNSFFLINILNLPRTHPFNAARQALMCLCAVPAVEEWYEYTRHVRAHYLGREWFEYTDQYKGRKPRIGHATWLLTVTMCFETAAVVKYSFSLGLLKSFVPGPSIWMPWVGFFLVFGTYFVIHCWLYYKQERAYPLWLRVLCWASALPLLGLTRLWAY